MRSLLIGLALLSFTGSLGASEPLHLDLGGGVNLELAWIPPGEFLMGTNHQNSDEWPPHQVTISRNFWMGIHEVTQAQWRRVMNSNPAMFTDDQRPVERISWHDAQTFLQKLNRLLDGDLPEGQVARLPTEAEWVYACRAGTKSEFWFGDDSSQLSRYGNFADASGFDTISWRDLDQDDRFSGTAPVGSFPPNPWGLYDMHGNVWEWCADWYAAYPTNALTDPTGPRDGRRRVIRGGGWGATAEDCRSANRYRFKPDIKRRQHRISHRDRLAPALNARSGATINHRGVPTTPYRDVPAPGPSTWVRMGLKRTMLGRRQHALLRAARRAPDVQQVLLPIRRGHHQQRMRLRLSVDRAVAHQQEHMTSGGHPR
jgi:sulfatase modifying factor 1